jgi:hypothetical protein
MPKDMWDPIAPGVAALYTSKNPVRMNVMGTTEWTIAYIGETYYRGRDVFSIGFVTSGSQTGPFTQKDVFRLDADMFQAYRMLLLVQELKDRDWKDGDLDYVYHVISGTECARTQTYEQFRGQVDATALARIMQAMPPQFNKGLAQLHQRYRLSGTGLEAEWDAGRLTASMESDYRGYGMRTKQDREREEEIYAQEAPRLLKLLERYFPQRLVDSVAQQAHREGIALLLRKKHVPQGEYFTALALYNALYHGGPNLHERTYGLHMLLFMGARQTGEVEAEMTVIYSHLVWLFLKEEGVISADQGSSESYWKQLKALYEATD